jgi:FkbM family methyltransferase
MTRLANGFLKATQIACALYRFNTLRIASRVFSNVSADVLSRDFCGRTLYVDIKRGNPQRLLYLEGERFIEERSIVRRLVRPGLGAVDVGANIGYYALMLANQIGPGSEVICIEPEPANLVELRRNIVANHLTNITVLAAAAAAEDGSAELLRGINGQVVPLGHGEIRVRTLALDSLADRAIGFIKIDVEGYELEVLRGARNLISRHRPNLFVEVHPQFQLEPDGVVQVVRLILEYYPDAVAYTRRGSTVIHKIGQRYFGRPAFRSSPVDMSLAEYPQIFWIACSPDCLADGARRSVA